MRVLVLFLMLSNFFFYSCNEIYFNNPMPNDSQNSYTVPEKYIGKWQLEDDIEISIGKNFYEKVDFSAIVISKNTFDSIRKSPNTYLLNDEVYQIKDGEVLGANYKTYGDSIKLKQKRVTHVDFGKNVFLRPFDYGYILNTKHDKFNSWWKTSFIDTRSKEGLLIRQLRYSDFKTNTNHILAMEKSFDKFILANWSKRDLMQFIDKGGFSDTLYFLKQELKTKN